MHESTRRKHPKKQEIKQSSCQANIFQRDVKHPWCCHHEQQRGEFVDEKAPRKLWLSSSSWKPSSDPDQTSHHYKQRNIHISGKVKAPGQQSHHTYDTRLLWRLPRKPGTVELHDHLVKLNRLLHLTERVVHGKR